MEHPTDSQSCWLRDRVGPVGQVVLESLVDSSASLLAGREAQGESEGAILEVQEVGHLVDPEVGHLVNPEVDHPVGPREGYPEVQVVGSYHSG